MNVRLKSGLEQPNTDCDDSSPFYLHYPEGILHELFFLLIQNEVCSIIQDPFGAPYCKNVENTVAL